MIGSDAVAPLTELVVVGVLVWLEPQAVATKPTTASADSPPATRHLRLRSNMLSPSLRRESRPSRVSSPRDRRSSTLKVANAHFEVPPRSSWLTACCRLLTLRSAPATEARQGHGCASSGLHPSPAPATATTPGEPSSQAVTTWCTIRHKLTSMLSQVGRLDRRPGHSRPVRRRPRVYLCVQQQADTLPRGVDLRARQPPV